VKVDAVGHSPVALDPVAPLLASVGEGDAGGEDVPAVTGVRVLGQRCGQLDGDLAIRGDADRLVPVPLAGLAVGGEEPAFRFPPLAPCGLGESWAASRL
jgi:hypothetical protein